MTRRNKDLRSEDREIQDGGRTPRAAAKHSKASDWAQDTALKLSQYARTPHSPQGSSGHSLETERPPLPTDGSEEEGSDREEGNNVPGSMNPATRPKVRHEMSDAGSLHHEQSEPTLRDVLQAVNQCNSALSSLNIQFGALKDDITHIRHDVQKAAERATLIETRISELEDQFTPVQRDSRKNNQAITALWAKADDLENRSRRNNARVVGVPEKVEGSNPSDYFESWLLKTFGKETLTPLYAVERAHRVPMRPLPPGAPPRPVLIKLLHFKDRDNSP